VQAARLGTVETIEDAGYSAKDLKRPGVQEELQALEAGEAKALVVAKLDRLSRSMIDLAGLMATAQKQNWALVALDCVWGAKNWVQPGDRVICRRERSFGTAQAAGGSG
jgi:DNA invertase Pin-like site-specific DNA recombinase